MSVPHVNEDEEEDAETVDAAVRRNTELPN